MSYLYVLIKYFYNDLIKIKNEDNGESLGSKLQKNIIGEKKQNISRDILEGRSNLYEVLEIYFQNGLCDIDLLCDFMANTSYENIPTFNFRYSDKSKLLEFDEIQKEQLENSINDFVLIDEGFRLFALVMRNYYLNDFMIDSNKFIDLKSLISRIKEVNMLRFYRNHNRGYQDVLRACVVSNLVKQDFVGRFIDSKNTRNLIIEQQKYYINELERLVDAIDEKGNVTNLDDDTFNLFVKFIFEFKTCAYNKIETLNKMNKKCAYKKLLSRGA